LAFCRNKSSRLRGTSPPALQGNWRYVFLKAARDRGMATAVPPAFVTRTALSPFHFFHNSREPLCSEADLCPDGGHFLFAITSLGRHNWPKIRAVGLFPPSPQYTREKMLLVFVSCFPPRFFAGCKTRFFLKFELRWEFFVARHCTPSLGDLKAVKVMPLSQWIFFLVMSLFFAPNHV